MTLCPSTSGLALCCLLVACSSGKEDSADKPTDLPPEDTSSITYLDSGVPFGDDTGLGGGYSDNVPLHTLTMMHLGSWELLPLGGPYTSMVGELSVVELLDGDTRTPWCQATFSLTGQLVSDKCTTCEYAFVMEFYLISEGDPKEKELPEDERAVGGLADCQSPELPEDGESRIYGFSADEGAVYFNYYGSGIWIPWYDGAQIRDEVSFDWEETAGFSGVEEEDDQ